MALSSRVKLGVNIDHIATLRQARKVFDPDPVEAARVARAAGADMIVTHLRRDRRHIQDDDLFKLCKLKWETHLEISTDPEIVAVALKAKPASVCLVPESEKEVTTQGGLALDGARAADVEKAIARLKGAGIEVSLFIEPEATAVRGATKLGADAVEFCTTAYSEAEGKGAVKTELERLALAAYLANEIGLTVHAGHGLDYHNAPAVARIPHVACLNIGFSIVARAVFVGLKAAVGEMKQLIA